MKDRKDKSIYDILDKYHKLAWFISMFLVVMFFLTFFFVWEQGDSEAQQSKSIPFEPTNTFYTVPGNLGVDETLFGASGLPIQVDQDMVFVDEAGFPLYQIYVEGDSTLGGTSTLGSDFDKTLVLETISDNGISFASVAFFDGINGLPTLMITQGTSSRYSIFHSGLIIGTATTTIDTAYTTCPAHGVEFLECSTDVGEADLFVVNNVEIGGDLFVQGTIHRPMAKITKSAPQSIPNNTGTVITWDEELYDTDEMHSTSTNNERITINTAGTYSSLFVTEWEGNGSGTRVLIINVNGSSVAFCRVMADVRSQGVCNWVGELEVDDFLSASVLHTRGSSLDFEAGVSIPNTFLEAHKID